MLSWRVFVIPRSHPVPHLRQQGPALMHAGLTGSQIDSFYYRATVNWMPWPGFEPGRLTAPPPQDGVSTSFTTRAEKTCGGQLGGQRRHPARGSPRLTTAYHREPPPPQSGGNGLASSAIMVNRSACRWFSEQQTVPACLMQRDGRRIPGAKRAPTLTALEKVESKVPTPPRSFVVLVSRRCNTLGAEVMRRCTSPRFLAHDGSGAASVGAWASVPNGAPA